MGATIFVKVSVAGVPDQVFRFERSAITIGSARENDLVLAHGSVAARHVQLVARDGQLILVDAQSPGGTYVDQQRIESPVIVSLESVIRIGAYMLRLVDGAEATQEASFLDAIANRPGDDDLRCGYCDWLEEHGRPEQAEFLRAQLTIKRLAPEDPEIARLSARLHALAPKMALAWRRTVAEAPLENCSLQQEIVCPRKWEALAPTPSPTKRFCDACKRDVHYASTVGDARRLAVAGECVVVDIGEPRSESDLTFVPVRVPNPGMYLPPPPPPPPPDDDG